MGLNVRLGKYQFLLSKERPPVAKGDEQGTSGSKYDLYFDNEQSLGGVKEPSVRQIMNMIDNDGTAAGLYSVMTFPVLASDWYLKPHPLDVVKGKDGVEVHPQSDFAERALRRPHYDGGMSTPFSLILADILLGIAQGHRFFEIVYKLDDEGYIVFKKVVAREHGTYKIKKDEHGGFDGVEQKVPSEKGKTKTVHIELPYSFLYTYRKERNKLEGKSAFRAGFYHYDKKHRLYYLANQQGQVAAIPYKVLEAPAGAEKPQRDENLRAVDQMTVRASIALPAGYKLNVITAGKSVELLPYIDHHNVEMARAVLAEGQMLGTMSDSKGGSYGLAESKMDMFMFGERYIMQSVEEHVTSFLVSKLISYNFAEPLYPEFKFSDLTDTDATLVMEGFKSLIAKGAVKKWVADGIADRIAKKLDIKEPEDDDGSEDYIGITNTPTNPSLNSRISKKKDRLSKDDEDWWRDLTPTESKVQFANIKNKAANEEEKTLADLRPVFEKIKDDALERLQPLLEGDKSASVLDGFELKYGDDLQKVMVEHMTNMYSVAKTGAADELKVKAPANKTKSKDLMAEHTKAIVEKQTSDMLFSAKAIVTDAVRKNLLAKTELSIFSVLSDIAKMFDDFFDDKEPLTVNSIISTAINIGRDDVFMDSKNKIYGYQYSAILDDKTCAICLDLDGSVVEPEVYYNTIWVPPIHYWDRCIWVAILEEEQDKPDFKDIPEAPGGADSPLLTHAHEHSEYAIYLSKEVETLWQKRRS